MSNAAAVPRALPEAKCACCCACDAALAAERKLFVDGGCRKPWFIGGRLAPCWRARPPGTVSTEPNVGVVARWMSSGGGGEVGREGGISLSRADAEDPGRLRSGMKDGGGMLLGGGGMRGGGGSIIVGGRVLSTGGAMLMV